ncbi:MAG TPA: hypothetical protein VJ476_02360 [Rhizomicrobium sp.]|nr:hypothetical protein [Rhizomicrobium sp.]
MSDERNESESTGQVPSGAAAFAALAYASRDKADAFLEEQTRLAREQAAVARLQADDLRREDSLRHWSLRVRHISDVVKVTFEVALALLVIAIVAGLSAVLWNAAHDDALVIEAFSVPPDLASRGLTGQAIAAQLQDKLASMQNLTNSGRPAKSFANSWGDGIKVMIPDTGIAVGDLYRTLAGWLGSQTHITGEVYRTPTGIAITSRSNGAGGATVAGSEADFDSLLQKSAEAIYRHTQPYRYAVYLASTRQMPQAMPLYIALAETGDREDRLWAHMGISSAYERSRPFDAPDENRKALAIDPDFFLAWQNIDGEEFALGHPGAALAATRKVLSLFDRFGGQLSERARAISLPSARGNAAYYDGDFQAAVSQYAIASGLPDYAGIAGYGRMQIADCLALLHERGAASNTWANFPKLSSGDFLNASIYYPIRIESDAASEDWSSVIADGAAAETAFNAITDKLAVVRPGFDLAVARQILPFVALAKAQLGDGAAARALIDRTPVDCYLCLRMRGKINALQKNWPAAAYWFERAVEQSPDIPFAYAEWGQMLMAKGDFDGAIAKFDAANKAGPHFADPLELWGEALIAKNHSDLALAKFQEANNYAPNWGRLHLKWGEALWWSGDKDGAKKQFAIAATLDLTPSEKSQLARVPHG